MIVKQFEHNFRLNVTKNFARKQAVKLANLWGEHFPLRHFSVSGLVSGGFFKWEIFRIFRSTRLDRSRSWSEQDILILSLRNCGSTPRSYTWACCSDISPAPLPTHNQRPKKLPRVIKFLEFLCALLHLWIAYTWGFKILRWVGLV